MNWAMINDLTLNWVDWVIIIVVSLSTLLSLWRGFVREALSLAAWVVAFISASMFADPVAASLLGGIDNVTGRYLTAYVLIFVAVLVLGTLLNGLMAKLVKLTGLSLLDRLLGTVFGFTRGVIVVLVAVFIAQELLPLQSQQAILESEIMPHLEIVAHWMRTVFMDISGNWNSGINV